MLLSLAIAHPALSCADGPDAFRVAGVASDDTLNVRSGPGVEFSVVGELPYNAVDVRNLDAVPVNACDGTTGLTRYERDNFWTKILWERSGVAVSGWVKSGFLKE